MSGKKQSFRFRLPWLPSLVSAPVPPARRLSSKQRSRKTSPPPPPPIPPTNDIMSVIPVQRQIVQPEAESPAQSIQPLAEIEPQPQLPETESQPQQPLTQDAMLHSRIDSQLPYEGLEVAPGTEPTESQIKLVSGTDSIPLQPSQGPESQPLPETDACPSPTRESKPHSDSQGALLIRTKSQSPSPPTRAKSQSRTSSQTSTPTRTRSKSSSPFNAGNYTRSTVKQPSPSRGAAHPRTTSLPPAQSRAVKSAKTSSKSPSPPFSPSMQLSSSYSTGESSSSSNQQQAPRPGQPRSDDLVSIITISGDNKGATLHLGSALLGKAPRYMAYKSDPENEVKTTSDGEGKDPGTKHEHQSNMAYVNSNIQSINNSMLLSSSVYERNPGVHFGPLGKNGFLKEANKKEAASYEAAHNTQVNGTTAGKVAHQPIIRRRCLRGLFMESSESEPNNPDKPRRHGCRYACGDKGKLDF